MWTFGTTSFPAHGWTEFVLARVSRNLLLLSNLKKAMCIAILLGCVSPTMACPMCKDSSIDSREKTPVADTAGLDFNHSVYAMLGGLGAVIGVTARVMYKAAKSS